MLGELFSFFFSCILARLSLMIILLFICTLAIVEMCTNHTRKKNVVSVCVERLVGT